MISHAALPLAATVIELITRNLDWAVAALIVLVGLVVYGGRDLFRFSPLRARAVASVCFHESIRRRVLWLTPLAILGVVLVSQFQRPLDDQDAIRQITRFCVFASGLLVTVAAIILACTNLPKEIDNRVIYTVVTKPTSRLEILVGKITGFAAVSALILIIMGVFSWGYLHLQEWRLMKNINQQIADGPQDPAAKQTLQFYAAHGLLNARDYRGTLDVQAMAAYPKPEDPIRWFTGANEQEVLVPFKVDPASVRIGSDVGMYLAVSVPWEQLRPFTAEELQGLATLADAAHVQNPGPAAPAGPGVATTNVDLPAFTHILFYSQDLSRSIELEAAGPVPLYDRTARKPQLVPVSPAMARQVLEMGQFFVAVGGLSPATRFGVGQDPVTLLLASDDPQKPVIVHSQPVFAGASTQYPIMGRLAQNGQQLRGDTPEAAPVGIFAYRNRQFPPGQAANIEVRTVVDLQGEESDDDTQRPTILELSVANHQSGKVSPVLSVPVDSRRTAYASLPAEYIAGGNFDVLVRSVTPGHWIGLTPTTIRIAAGDGSFTLNLVKSYLILWLLSVLVIMVAILCSTFLSWPIAVVLTVVVLLGHWGVMQLGEMAAPGVGRQVVNDLFAGAAPAVTETLTRSMEGLSSLIRLIAAFLPDISRFAAMDDISQGSAISLPHLISPLVVVVLFGLPILSLSYVFFRNKEVAP